MLPDSSESAPPKKPSTRRVKRDMEDPRTAKFVIRLRPSERDRLASYAEAHGLFLSELCRHRLLEWEIPRPTRLITDAKLYGVLSQISVSLRNSSNNLNQLTKAHHLGFPPGMEVLAQSMKELQSEIDELRREMSGMASAIGKAPAGPTRWAWINGYTARIRTARDGT